MEYYSSIHGYIEGISKDTFELIKGDLEYAFETVSWEDKKIDIYSYGLHYDTDVVPAYIKIAACLDENGYGELTEQGEEGFDVSTVFFSGKEWKKVWAEIILPENPFLKKKKWMKQLSWKGKITSVECVEHSYAWSGNMPCTGLRKCIFCGKPE